MAGYGDQLRELAPHYFVIVVAILIALMIVDMLFEDLSFTWRLIVALAIGLGYPLFLRLIGRAPEPWQ